MVDDISITLYTVAPSLYTFQDKSFLQIAHIQLDTGRILFWLLSPFYNRISRVYS